MLDIMGLVTRRWRRTVVLTVFALLVPVASASADHRAPFDGSQHDYGEMVDYDLVFPVAGDHTLWDTFYASRSGGDHHAQDIMADKMTPIVAAASGTIRYINWSRSTTDLNPERCCTMVITHDDGWESWYIHMNNDTPGTDDGQGWGIADGLLPGQHVDAGQLIGWVGDSGNAEYTGSHLHFELYDPEGVLVNPYQALLGAANPGTPFNTLSMGSQSQRVLQLQAMLASLGFDPGPADGSFGSLTETAVEQFQDASGLPVTGVVDQATWDVLETAFAAAQDPPTRLAGADRYKTAEQIARRTHPSTASTVFVAVGTNFPDAIGGGPAAAALDAPILLVLTNKIPNATERELRRMDPDRIVILGGTGAVGSSVESGIRSIVPGAEIVRIAGRHRYDTAVGVSKIGFPGGADTVYVAPGESFAEALAAAPAAISEGGSLLLVRSDMIHGSVKSELNRLDPSKIVVVGNTSAVSTAVFNELAGYADSIVRVSGSDGYATSAAVSAYAFPDGADTLYVAVGDKYPDALTGGAATAKDVGPLLLVRTTEVPNAVANEVRRLDPSKVVVFGGSGAVSDAVAATLVGLAATSAPPPSDPDEGSGGSIGDPPEITYDPSQGSEQWRPLVEYVFALWDLDVEKCGTGSRSGDCIGGQVDNAIIIMQCESFGNPTIVNTSSGTTGLFQHRPVTDPYWAPRVARVRTYFPDFPTTATPFDPYDNVMVAALLVHESRDDLLGYHDPAWGGPWGRGPAPWGHWDGSAPASWCHDPPLVTW